MVIVWGRGVIWCSFLELCFYFVFYRWGAILLSCSLLNGLLGLLPVAHVAYYFHASLKLGCHGLKINCFSFIL